MDEADRDLERRAPHDPEARRNLLSEKLRSDVFGLPAVMAAALLGDEDAAAVADVDPANPPRIWRSVTSATYPGSLCSELSCHVGPKALVRFGFAVARIGLKRGPSRGTTPVGGETTAAWNRLVTMERAFLTTRGEAHRRDILWGPRGDTSGNAKHVGAWLSDLWRAVGRLPAWTKADDESPPAGNLRGIITTDPEYEEPPDPPEPPEDMTAIGLNVHRMATKVFSTCDVSVADMAAAGRRWVVPWLLGEDDPLARLHGGQPYLVQLKLFVFFIGQEPPSAATDIETDLRESKLRLKSIDFVDITYSPACLGLAGKYDAAHGNLVVAGPDDAMLAKLEVLPRSVTQLIEALQDAGSASVARHFETPWTASTRALRWCETAH